MLSAPRLHRPGVYPFRVYGRGDRRTDQFVPGWQYSFVAALEAGRTSWCALLDTVRLGPADDATLVTVAHLSHALAELPVVLVGRLRSDRVMLRDPGPARSGRKGGRPRRHGGVLAFARPDTWHEPDVTTTTRYGKAAMKGWDRMLPRLTHRGPWLEHARKELPVINGTLVRLEVEYLPGDRAPKPVWPWSSAAHATPADVDRWWQCFLRRFDLEHTFRLMKQTLDRTAPKIRHAATADLWTWLINAAHTQLRLARRLQGPTAHGWQDHPVPQPPHRRLPHRDGTDHRPLITENDITSSTSVTGS